MKNCEVTGPVPDPTSSSGLRRALFAARPTFQASPLLEPRGPGRVPPPPSAPELLDSSPNLQRLCESYHRTYMAMVERSRRQRIGIALLVAAMAVESVYMQNAGLLNPATVSNLVLTVSGASCMGLGIMAMLWLRDDRRLRNAQGERLMRALAFNCDLPTESLEALRLGLAPPSQTFFACYQVWKSQHRTLRGGFPMMFGGGAA